MSEARRTGGRKGKHGTKGKRGPAKPLAADAAEVDSYVERRYGPQD